MQKQFPKLSRVALSVLTIPASSSPSERAFSACGHTMSKKRARLSAESLDSLVVLKSSKNL